MNRSLPFAIFVASALLASGPAGLLFGFNISHPGFWAIMGAFSLSVSGVMAVWFNRTHADWFTAQDERSEIQEGRESSP